MPEYLSNKKRKQSIGINSYSEYTDTTKIIGNVLVGFGSIGVGTTIPTEDVDVNTIRVRDTLYDYTNSGGVFGYYLVKDTDGIKWVAVPPIDSNAIFVAENNNIVGVSSFTGINIISDELIGVSTNPINSNFADIRIVPRWLKSGETGIYTTKNVGIGTTIPTTDFQVGFGTTGVTIDGSVGVVSALGYYGNYAFIDQITVNDQLNVVGLGSTLVAAFLGSGGGITTTGGDLYVGGSLFADRLDIINLKVVNIEATGITTLNVGIVSTFRVTGVSTLGVTSTADLFVDANLRVSGITTLGITSTADLFVDANLEVAGISTFVGFSTFNNSVVIQDNLLVSGLSTFVGVGTFSGDLYVSDILYADVVTGLTSTTDLLVDGNLRVTGISTLGVTTTTNLTSQQLNVSGITTLGVTSTTDLTSQQLNVSGITTLGITSTTNLTTQQLNVSAITTLGVTTISQLYVSGVSTFVGAITGTISTATKLETQRTFEITGDVVASPIFFDGTGNVSLAATIQPNSVELGVDTFGDYVESISGKIGEIVVTGGTGEGSTPVISFDPNPTIGGNVIIGNNLQVNNNLNVNGNITIGGTSATLNTETLTVTDAQILLGVTTSSNLSDISTDLTANTGGIAIASTEGTPLVNLTVVGIDTLPATYKRFVWVSAGTFAGLGTDAWLSNYAIGIGSTQFPAGTRLAVGSVQFTENDLAVVRNINSSGITTLGVTSTTNLTSQQLNVSGITTLGVTSTTNLTTRQLNVTGILTASRIVGTSLSISGISTIANFLMTPVGTGATVGGIGVTYYGDGSQLTKISSSSGYADTAGIATNVIGGIASVTSLDVSGITTLASIVGTSLSISGISTLGVTSTTNLTSQQLNVTGITTLASIVGTSLSISGISTLGVTSTTNLTSQQLNVSGITTLGVTSTTNLTSQQLNVSGITTLGITTLEQLYVSGVSTFVGVGTFSGNLYVGGDLYVADDLVFDEFTARNANITGISTLGVTSTTNLTTQQLNVSGITTLGITTISQLYVSGVSTFVGVGTFSGNLYVGGDLYVADDLVFDEFTARNANITGVTTLGITSTTNLTTQQLNVSGITTLASIVGTSLSISGISTLGITSTTNLTTQQLNVSGISTLGITTITQLYVSGVSTFIDRITGIISTATKLENPRIFEITGDVVASPIFFDGTGNVSLAATIQPNSVGLGTDTFGDYVKDITGTANQITVTGGTGEGSSPILSIPNQFNVPQDLIVIRDVQINRDLNVNGNITIGGTSAILFTQTFKVYDSDIILGVRTDGNGNDISTDSSANHGGIAIASTDGNPLVTLTNTGIGETLPATYKKIMWFKEGSFAGLGTDAWLSNYALGVGTTELQAGTVLAAGSVQFSKDDLKIVRNINASGIITAPEFKGTLTGYASSAGIATHINGGAAGNVVYQSAPDTTTFVNNSSATSGQVLLWNGSAPFWGNVTSSPISGYADNAGISTNVIGGIASVTSLNVTGIATLGVTSTSDLTSQQLTVTGITTLSSIVGTSLSITGISTIANFILSPVGTGATVGGIGVTYYGDGSNLTNVVSTSGYADVSGVSTNSNYATSAGISTYADTAGISTNVIGGIASVTSLNVTGITTLGTVEISSGIITATTGIVTYYGDGSKLTDVVSASGYADIAGIATYADTSGISTISTNVIGGIASVTSLDVSGITTLGSVEISSGIVTAKTGIVTYYGDGSKLSGVSAFSVQQQDITSSPVYPTFASNIGTSSLGIAATELVYIPASGNLGIGTTTPTSKLTVVGDVLISGVLTATRLYSSIYGEFVGGSISGSDIVGTSLSISGISTLGSVKISSGIITSTTGIVTYYGDGSNLTNVVGAFGGIGTAGGTVGTGITFLDFRGSGISSITASAGIATITIPGASRSVNSYTAEEGETSFPATYTPEYADVYLNGSKLSETEYTASNGTSIELTEGASAGDIVEIVSYLINITGGSSTPDISPVMMGMIF